MREPRPVLRVEISEKYRKLRLILAIVFVIIAAVSLTVGITSLLQQDAGWQEVRVNPQERSCSQNFLLRYDFSGSGPEATAVNRQLEQLYGDATVKAYQLFTPDEGFPDVVNVYAINRSPGEALTVDPVLYDAFRTLEGTPWLYLGPVYEYYTGLIYNAEEAFLPQLDPAENEEAAEMVKTIAAFAADRDAVRLELLGNNQIILHVSQAYRDFVQNEELENFIDFSYMTNAFVIDYLADTLLDAGLTRGYIDSVDGYTRNLDAGNQLGFTVFDRVENVIYPAGVMQCNGFRSKVLLKDYPTGAADSNYRASSGHNVHLFADPADGMYRASVPNLIGYSYKEGCAQVLLKMLPGFVGGEFSLPEDVFSIWCQENTVFYNDPLVSVDQLLSSPEVTYTAEFKS